MNVGTPIYMSPEQIKGEKYGYSSDIYSFGMTMFNILTLDCDPFKGM